MHCSIKDFVQIHEKKLTLLPLSTKMMQHVCSLPICQKFLHVPSILVCHINGLNFKEYHQRISLQTKLPSLCRKKFEKARFSLFWVGESSSEVERESHKKLQNWVFSKCKNDFSLLYLYKVMITHFN